MDWFEEKYRRQIKEKAEQEAIARYSGDLYESLWGAVRDVVSFARVKGMTVGMNGFPEHRTVVYGARNLTLDLAEDKRSIQANFSDLPQVEFRLSVREDGTVAIMFGDSEASYSEAARAVMEPFFFSEG